MTVVAWPSSLPPLVSVSASGRTDELVDAPRETVFDDGPPRARRQTLFVAPVRSVRLWLTRTQFVAFRNFVLNDLNSATKRFTAPIRLPSGALGTRTCRITGKIAEEDQGPRSSVMFNVRVYDW